MLLQGGVPTGEVIVYVFLDLNDIDLTAMGLRMTK
jgi:hypothetical protein